MKDRQTNSQGPQHSIPLVSPILHLLAMPAIVYLRSGFGFSFLSSKIIFLSLAWAQVLFSIYAWYEEDVWAKYWAVAAFGDGAVALYATHLLAAFSREVKRTGRHDFYSGTSHILRLPGFSQLQGGSGFETIVHLWLEPLVIAIAATLLRAFAAELVLSRWLLLVAASLWLKEFINYWYRIRHDKKEQDIFTDAEEKMGRHVGPEAPLPKAAGRKARVKRPPGNSGQSADESRFAEVLRLMPPYDLEQAEKNYRALIKTHHPDPKNATREEGAKAAELNDAIEFFRSMLGG